ncbi:MAG: SynChlorMet cassette protein ScmC [Bacillota bacterium]
MQTAAYNLQLANGFTIGYRSTLRAQAALAEFAEIYQLSRNARPPDYNVVVTFSDEHHVARQEMANCETGYAVIGDLQQLINHADYWLLHYLQLQRIGLHGLRNAAMQTVAVPVHCALAVCNGGGYVFAGSSGVGKSTLYDKMQAPWRAVCDDNALIVKSGNSYFVQPLPTWSRFMYDEGGYPVATAEYFPLRGVYFLTQADCDECRPIETAEAILRLRKSAEEASFIWQMPKDERISLNGLFFERACEIIRQTPHAELFSTVAGRPWLEIERLQL